MHCKSDVGRLTDRISEKSVGKIRIPIVLRFRLDRRVMAELVATDDHRIEDRQFGDGRHLTLLEDRHFLGVEPD